ncbi:protein stand still [Condylostylus longicornis]|uniref:protein stand still n=1 Tax=Condylostylus longicornis TaxID=2530218 RepID=UPI00244DA0BE|nr:protein stand still [Condylostylus longicornis]
MDEKNVTSSESKKAHTVPYILKGEFFEIIKQEGEAVTVRCRKCPQKNIYKGSVKSTGNFHMHIKRKHPESLERLQELKLQSFMDRKIKIPERSKHHTLYTLINSNRVNNGNNISTPAINLYSNPIPITNHFEISSNNNQPINCCKKAKITTSGNIYEPKMSNIQNTQVINTSDEITSKCNQFKNLNDEKTIDKQNNSNNFYSLTPNATNFQLTSSEPSSKDQYYTFQTNGTSNNNLPITATLTAASMILSPTQEILGKIDNHLKSIERQLHLRNQIETNKIYLDLAKFKYLHPNFAFQG